MKGRVTAVAHLGVAVRDARASLALWADAIGLPLGRVETVGSEGVRTWFLDAGSTHVELLEALDEQTPVGRFLEKRGEGLHHVCLEVDDIEAMLARLAARGIDPVGAVREGAGGARVAFLHPRDTGGLLIELAEPAPGSASGPAFAPGTLAVVYLRDPREQCVGVVRRLDALGVALLGMDLDAWDDWVAQWVSDEAGPLAPSLQFFPAARIEKLLADSDSPHLPSFSRRFEERTGRALAVALEGHVPPPATTGPSDDVRERP